MEFSTEEGKHVLPDGTSLYTKTWRPNGTPRAILIFLHGFADHCNAYYNFFPTLSSSKHNIIVHAFDQRGWGRSASKPSQRGAAGPTRQILADIDHFINAHLPDEGETLPVFLMGHSMGGQLALYFCAHGPTSTLQRLRGVLLEAPFISFLPENKPSTLKVVTGKILSKILPHHKLRQEFRPQDMSRDPRVCEDWAADPLNYDTATLETLAGLLDRAAKLDKGEVVVRPGMNVWIGHGTGDKIAWVQSSEKMYERAKARGEGERWTVKWYDGWYHKLHAEPGQDKNTFADNVGDWILSKCTEVEAPEAVTAKL